MMRLRWITLLTLIIAVSGFAELTLPTVFSDHMVLQRGQPVPVWGKADPGTVVTVEFAGQTKTTSAGEDGKWRADLDPMPASAEPRDLKVSSRLKSETSNLNFSDVLVGEVWFCSGQSNMQMPFIKQPWCGPCDNADAEIAAANYPKIRLFDTPRVFSATPKETIDAHWVVCTPETVKTFSACAYYFGRKLHQDLNIPVGLLLSCCGATRIEPWTPPCGFESVSSLNDLYQQSLKLTELPEIDHHKTPSALYNGMIYAHVPFAIRGAIWYQGEGNHNEGMLYVDKNKALLNGWRKLWGYEFPFYFVQIAPYQYGNENPEILPTFWEAEAAIVKTIPKTGMAVISDHVTLDIIHPTDKKDPGIRLALLAEANTYNMNVVSTGPVFQSLETNKATLIVTFSSADGLTTRDGKAPDWFEIAGEDGVFKPAQAEIEGTGIILSSPDVPKPQAMRFAWSKLATPNLVNSAGLPASAFRAGKLPETKIPPMVQIPEMKGYRIIYQLDIDANANYANSAPKYDIDNSASDSAPFSQIAYCLELLKRGGTIQYAFASIDAFTDDLKKIGIPVVTSGARFMEQVSSLTVRSNVESIVPCTDSDGGNIEFWPGNYSSANHQKIPGAANDKYDFGDTASDKIPGYSCMQVHN